jgi:methylmalonyl-CoA mutase cobalamin-binding subunit
LADALKTEHAEKIKILVYGTMSEIDREFVYAAGAAQIIDSGQFNEAAVSRLLDMLE